VLTVIDPSSAETMTSYTPMCVSGPCDEVTLVVDADGNQSDTYSDALGRVVQSRRSQG
jgi:hypothetical protein